MIKKISLLLVALLLLGTLTVGFVGCADTEDGYDVGTSNTVNTQKNDDGYIADDLPENNFGGDKVIILTSTWRNTPDYILQKEITGNIVNDAMVQSYYNVSERFNMEIDLLIPGDQMVVQSTVENAGKSGDTSFDIVYNHDTRTVANAVNGNFLNIKSMELVNLDKPWWTASSQKFQIANKLYFTSSYLGIWSPYMNMGLYYNKDIASENGITMPYDNIIAGNWYIDDMIEMTKNLKIDKDGDGEITTDKDQYGYVTSYHGNLCAQANLVGSFISQDGKGGNKINADIERCSNYMSTMERLYANGIGEYEGVTSYNMDIFKDGRALFIFSEARTLVENRNDITFNWGMIPFPKYDENQKEYSSAGYDLFWGVNINVAHRSEIISTAVEALSCQNYNNVYPVIWEEFFGYKLSENVTDYKMVCIVRDATFVNPDYVYDTQILGMTQLLNLWDTAEKSSVSSHITTNTNLAKVSLKLCVEKFSQMP